MDFSKISLTLAAAVSDYQRAGRPALLPHQTRMGLVSVERVARPARIVAFLHTAEGASLDHLAALGVEVNEGSGPVRTGIVPLDALDQLSEDGAITRIVASRPLKLLMDVAPVKIRVPELRKATKLTGKGVIVGVVDSGIEPTHPNFAGRLLRIWDQTLNGAGVPEGQYGAELTGEMLGLSRDTNGHGTHVAGIIASADPTFGGIAPEAELVVVKTDRQTAHIADGVRYIFRVAKELRRPAVVNLSLGGHGDAHDGTDSLSQVIDEAVGPGRIVCCAAGNEGNDNIHAVAILRKDGTRTIPLVVAPNVPIALHGWYEAKDQIDVAVVSPSNVQTDFQAMIPTGPPVIEYQLPEGRVQIMTGGPDPANRDVNFVVVIEPLPVPPDDGTKRGAWRVRVRGRKIKGGRVDLWTIDERAAQFTGATVADDMKVGSPGSATRAITVAAYTSKTDWTDLFGDPHGVGLELDDIASFSSEGPRRDLAEKPDVAAPGAMIVSCLSVHAPVTPPFLVDDLNTVLAGTSQASPIAAGLVALLLERDRRLTPETAKKLLRASATVPGRPKGTFDPKWGYGLVDASKLAKKAPAPKKAAAKKAVPSG